MLDSRLNSTRTEKPTGVFTQLNRDMIVGLATVEHQQRTFLPRSITFIYVSNDQCEVVNFRG